MSKTKKDNGLMRVLMVMSYKDIPIYVRMIGKDVFIWDVIHNNQLFSSYVVIGPRKGEKKLANSDIDEIVKICYAGAAATIDNILGIPITEDEEVILKQFEAGKKAIQGTA